MMGVIPFKNVGGNRTLITNTWVGSLIKFNLGVEGVELNWNVGLGGRHNQVN